MEQSGSALPSGTVTFLLTDIENSTGHWETAPEAMRVGLAAHDALVADAITAHGGIVVKHMGDGCWAAFSSAASAAAAATEFQRRHQQETLAGGLRLKVRIGLHTGAVEPSEGDYFGPAVNRAARVVDLANGDQIVCSASTARLLPNENLRSDGLHELRGIGAEEIFLVLAEGAETSERRLRRPFRPTNLPRSRTSFLGRDDDIAQAMAFLEDQSVVTLVGPGGVGKTRLAIEVGAQLSSRFHQLVYFCDLVPVAAGDADAVVEVVAEILGARRQPGMDLVESIADHVSGRPSLIILDNCEHVLRSVQAMVERLVEVDGVHVLATSREALGLLDEQQLIVEPLTAATTGVELFVDRARRRDSQFELTSDNDDAINDVVNRLDGLPLAIELAAARIRLMTPGDLARGLAEGLPVLGERGRDRHETLRETVRWSFDLLPPAEAELFTRLTVFAGGFTLDAVAEICADDDVVMADQVPDLLIALVDKSMVVSSPVGGHQRFGMLETLSAFASAELEGTEAGPELRRRHADYFGRLAARQNDRLFSAAEPDVWRILDQEWTNLRVALDTFEAASDVDRGAALVVALVWFANTAMRFEVFTWAEELLEASGIESHPVYTDLCGAAALGGYFTVSGDPVARAEAGLAVNPADPQGFCRAALAAVAMNNDQDADAAEAVTAAWLDSDPSTVGGRLWTNAFRTFYLCTYAPSPEAAERLEVVTALAGETGSSTAKAIAAWAEGQVMSFEDLRGAMQTWSTGLEWSRSLPDANLMEPVLEGLILHFTVLRGDLLASLIGCRDAVRGALERHYHAGTSHLFGATASVLCQADDAATGAQLVAAMAENGHRVRREYRRPLEAALGEGLDEHMAPGRALSITQAGHLAIDALESAIEREKSSAGSDPVGSDPA